MLGEEMTKPKVLAVMLANGRAEMVYRAVRSFNAQTYQKKRLLIWDSTADYNFCYDTDDVVQVPATPRSIGTMRNHANAFWAEHDVIIHFDSDDISHPCRIAEQVALLQASGRPAVGYNEMLFWDTRPGAYCGAWRYRNPNPQYALGTSLCYWRKTWEARPFADINDGEDERWLTGLGALGVSSIADEPRMIAAIHGANTATRIPATAIGTAKEWNRAPEWDGYCRKVMAL